MTDDLVFVNERDPSMTPPKPHRSGLPVLADKRPPLPPAMQPGDSGLVDIMSGTRVVVQRGPGYPGIARSTTKGARGMEVYVRLDQGTGAWFPLAELGPGEETYVAAANHVILAADVARNAGETVVLAFQVRKTEDSPPTVHQLGESDAWLAGMDFS